MLLSALLAHLWVGQLWCSKTIEVFHCANDRYGLVGRRFGQVYVLYFTGCVAQSVHYRLKLVTNKKQLIRSCVIVSVSVFVFVFVNVFVFHKLRSRELCAQYKVMRGSCLPTKNS